MGEPEVSSQLEGLLLNGLLPNETSNVTRVLDADRVSKIEERTAELIACIQPNRPSEEHRNAVANYVQTLIKKCFSCEVFTFGSVPFRTYLQDGDIDLTIFGKGKDLKVTWANAVLKVLENQKKIENAEFCVKEVKYIPAEVKIIKCLVENIVVDISFSQVGGLCTLCFLEEVDHQISQNHLLKRSVILIKAWCYYESRVLGAQYRLISTYALEILVLYIFHVFNNTFAGPFEVLYRFLEVFSKFDWDNFCVSLLGPVPISSLPNMTADLPRKDGGELLFDEFFYEACSTVYGVSLSIQENQGLQFVSKHFNIIDPLRTNNNLGRSVNKGNFYRIRSAFALGAKKLANLLDCPKENLIAEVNHFFMNTWERHGSSNRPDALIPSFCYVQSFINCSNEGLNNSRGITSLKKKSGSIGLQVNYVNQAGGGHVSRGYASHVHNTITKQAQSLYKTPNAVHVNSRDAETLERNATCSVSIQPEKNQKNSMPDYSVSNNEGKSRFQFSRMQSSPDFTGTFTDALSTSKTHKEHLVSEYSGMDSEVQSFQSATFSFDDPKSLRQSSSDQRLEVATDSNIISNSYHDDSGSTAMRAGLASDSEALELQQQKEQNLVDMVASSGTHNLIGQVQPVYLASHLPLPSSLVLASMGYPQRNWTGIVPSNIPLIKPSWGSDMQFTQGLGSSPLPYYLTKATQNSISEEADPVNENSGKTSPEDGENEVWYDLDAGSMSGLETENEGLQTHSVERHHLTASKHNYIPTSQEHLSSTSLMRGNHKVTVESKGQRDDSPGRANDVSVTDRNANLRFLPTAQSSTFRRKSSSGTSRDVLNSRATKSARDKWGRKPSHSVATTALSGKARSGGQFEGATEHISSSREDDQNQEWFPLSTADTHMEDLTLGSVPLASPHVSNSRYEAAQISVADTSTQIEPVIVGSSWQNVVDNSGVSPFAFNHADGANYDCSINQFAEDSGEQSHRYPSHQDIDIVDEYNQTEGHMNHLDSSTTKAAALEPSEVHTTDMLDSDYARHWQNLQYGRLCQNTPNYGPFVYSPPVMVPPVYLQDHYSFDGPGRPPAANFNCLTQVMGYGPQLVSVTSLQPGPSRPFSVCDRYGNEPPGYRAGTGTYLANTKASFRDRHSSNRNHRGSYNYDSSDKNSTEGSWISSKAKSASLPVRIDTAGRIHDERPGDVNPARRRIHDERQAECGGSSTSSPEKPSSPLP